MFIFGMFNLSPEKSICRSRSNSENWTGSKLGKEYVKAVYCHPVYLTYMQSTSCEMQGWMKHKLESRLTGEISVSSGTQGEGNGNQLQYSCLEKSHGQRSLVGCSPWGR